MKSHIVRSGVCLCAMVCALSMGGCSLLTPTISDAQSKTHATVSDMMLVRSGTLTVGLNTSDAPQAMMDSRGELNGYTVDVARSIAERLGLKVSFVNASSPGSALSEKKIDIYLGTQPDARSDALKVSASYLTSAVSLFGHDAQEARSLSAADLSGVSVGVQDASASQRVLTHTGITSKITTFKNVNECFEALAAGKVDYVACEATAGAYLARQYSGLGFVAAIASPKEYDILLRSTSIDLSERVTKVVDSISEDGVLEAIHTAWYGELPMALSDRLVSGIKPEAASADQDSVLDELGGGTGQTGSAGSDKSASSGA
ncbi:substrate-binding periplasmic protein [Coriobacterium glomerans]|nr:transporter substrate-binding domain-containing protein [Coriobacterium glomerans]